MNLIELFYIFIWIVFELLHKNHKNLFKYVWLLTVCFFQVVLWVPLCPTFCSFFMFEFCFVFLTDVAHSWALVDSICTSEVMPITYSFVKIVFHATLRYILHKADNALGLNTKRNYGAILLSSMLTWRLL